MTTLLSALHGSSFSLRNEHRYELLAEQKGEEFARKQYEADLSRYVNEQMAAQTGVDPRALDDLYADPSAQAAKEFESTFGWKPYIEGLQ